jgi:hypothetical protein
VGLGVPGTPLGRSLDEPRMRLGLAAQTLRSASVSAALLCPRLRLVDAPYGASERAIGPGHQLISRVILGPTPK